MSPPAIAVCEHCDAVHRRVPLDARCTAHCLRCGSVLYRARSVRLDGWLALSLTAVIVYAIANLNPIVALQLGGERTQATLFDALIVSWNAGVAPVALLAAICALVAPLLRIGLEVYVLMFLHVGMRPPGLEPAMHAMRLLQPWSMIEVFMLGIVVAVVKASADMTVIPGAGLAGFAALTVLAPLTGTFDTDALWDRAEKLRS